MLGTIVAKSYKNKDTNQKRPFDFSLDGQATPQTRPVA